MVDVGVLPPRPWPGCRPTRNVPAVVISASHNPFADNGIKLFAAGGAKLSVELEAAIEDELERDPRPVGQGTPQPRGARGRQRDRRARAGRGLRRAPGVPAGGSASRRRCGWWWTAPTARPRRWPPRSTRGSGPRWWPSAASRTGPTSTTAAARPRPGTLASAVVEHQADLGLALDGDADRLLAVGPDGTLVNGDELIALFALDLAERGQLAGNTVVVTVMTNLGFRLAMAGAGHHREGDPGRGPPRAGRPGQGRSLARRASSRATSSSGGWPPPATGC